MSICLAFGASVWLYSNQEVLTPLLDLGKLQILVIIGIGFLLFTTTTLYWYLSLKLFGISIGIVQLVHILSGVAMVNVVTPFKGGTLVLVKKLKHEGVSYGTQGKIFFVNQVMIFLIYGLLLILLLKVSLIVFSMLLLVFAVGVGFFFRKLKSASTELLETQPMILMRLIILTFVFVLLQGCIGIIGVFVELNALKLSLSSEMVILYYAIYQLTFFLDVAQVIVGGREVTLLVLQNLRNVVPSVVIPLSVFERAMSVVVNTLVFLVSSLWQYFSSEKNS